MYSVGSDFINTCRCCRSHVCFKNISSDYYDSGCKEVYENMLKETFNINLTYYESGTIKSSTMICDNCILQLRAAVAFKNMVIASEERLAGYFEMLQNNEGTGSCNDKDKGGYIKFEKIDMDYENNSASEHNDSTSNDPISIKNEILTPEEINQYEAERNGKRKLEQGIRKSKKKKKNLNDNEQPSSPLGVAIVEETHDVWDDVFSNRPRRNNDTPMSLTQIFNDLHSQSASIQGIEGTASSVPNKDNLSSMNRSEYEVPICYKHLINDFSCPSFDTLGTNCTEPPPSPGINKNNEKKRPRNYENWKDVKRKQLMNLGKKYCSKRGRDVEEKTMGPPCCCRFKCATKITDNERNEIFNKFWELGDREKQWLHVANYTKKQPKNRTFQCEFKRNRQYTYKYFLPKNDESLNNGKINVCKTMFLNTLGISERLVITAWKKYDGCAGVNKDMRGRHSNHKKIIDDEMIMSVCSHVNSFVPVESHHCCRALKKLHLDSNLSIARMFDLYKDWADFDKFSNRATTLRQYRDIINKHFNLSFEVPKGDVCDQCNVFKSSENPDGLKIDNCKDQKNKEISRHLKAQISKIQSSDV